MWIVIILKGIPVEEELFGSLLKTWYPEDYVQQKADAYNSDYYWSAGVGEYSLIVCGSEATLCLSYQIYDGGNNVGLELIEENTDSEISKFKAFVTSLNKDNLDANKYGTYITHAYYESQDEDEEEEKSTSLDDHEEIDS